MKKLMTALLTMAMLTALVLTGCGGEEQAGGDNPEDTVYTLRIGTGTGGRDKQVAWMEEFETQLEAATEGRIDVQCYPSGSIGTMAEMVQGVVDGSLDAGCFPTAY